MSYWFFFSYARDDDKNNAYVKKFFEELQEEVRTLAGPGVEAGFFDKEGIQHGEQWSEKLAHALQTSRTFISLCSATYFQKEFCGKEWAVFHERLKLYQQQQGKLPPLLLPVLWVPLSMLPKQLPAPVGDFQFGAGAYPDEYLKHGVRQLRTNGKYRDQYKSFVYELAKTIVETARQHEQGGNYTLPRLAPLPQLKLVPSAFHAAAGGAGLGAPPVAATNTPRYVQLIYVAEKRAQMTGLRKTLHAYGEGGQEWQPYAPPVGKFIHALVTSTISEENFLPNPVQLSDDLVKELKQAEDEKKIVVIVVDTWTLQIEKYQKLLREYDDRSFVNCVVLVPWNKQDDEAQEHFARLDELVKQVFKKRRTDLGGQHSFFYPVESPEAMRSSLITAIRKTRDRILDQVKVEGINETLAPMAQPIVASSGGS